MTIKMVSKDGYKAVDIEFVKVDAGCEVPHYELTTYTKQSNENNSYSIKAYGTLSEAVDAARIFTGRGTYEQTNKSDNELEVERFR